METLKKLSYPKQYILIEDEKKKIYKNLNNSENVKAADEYLYGVITVIQEEEIDGEIYSEIQYDDQKLGWISLSDSLQIFRFEKEVFRFIEEDFEVASINRKMELEKDFKAHFANRLLNIKSEIYYEGDWLYGVFIKEKFFGFHPKKNFEKMIQCNIELTKEEIIGLELFKNSDMKKTVTEELYFEDPQIILIFKNNKLGRIKINKKDFYWISLNGLEDRIGNLTENIKERSLEQKYIDDIFYSVDLERRKSKEIVKTVLSAKSYIEARDSGLLNKHTETHEDNDDSDERVKYLKKELASLKKENAKILKELRLSNQRLEQKKDYNDRLEQQKDKYKSRMNVVEDKLRKLNQKLNDGQ